MIPIVTPLEITYKKIHIHEKNQTLFAKYANRSYCVQAIVS